MSDENQWRRLAKLLADQRGRIEPNARKFADQSGLNYRLVWDLENAARTNYRPATLTSVEDAYGWEHGSIRLVLDGGEPVAKSVEIARIPKHPQRPEIESMDPYIQLRNAAPLRDGEELTGWRMDDGRMHYRYISLVGADLAAAMSADLPLEEVVKRARMMVDLADL